MVLLILGLLTKAALPPLSEAQRHRQHRQAEQELQSVKESLWAHVIATGALPCPVAFSSGALSPAALSPEALSQIDADTGHCRLSHGGVPARLLGLPGAIDRHGALLDPWNQPYRLTVSLVSHDSLGDPSSPDWTTPGEASRIGVAALSADLVLCTRRVQGRCPHQDVRADQLAFVLLSTGADAASTSAARPGSETTQSENLDGDEIFVIQPPSIVATDPFDDQLVWGTAAETRYWLLRAGWLP